MQLIQTARIAFAYFTIKYKLVLGKVGDRLLHFL